MAEEHDGDWNAQNDANGAEEHDRPDEGGEARSDSQQESQGEQPTVTLPPLGTNDTEVLNAPEYSNAQGQPAAVDAGSRNDDAGEASGDADDAANDGADNDGIHQTAVIEQGIPAAAGTPAQETESIPVTGSAATRSTEQPTTPLYRPAPEYGAYGPVPPQTQTQNNGNASGTQTGQSGQTDGGQAGAQSGTQGNRNPYFGANPFFNPGGQQANGQQSSGQPGNANQGTPGASGPYGAGNSPQGSQGPRTPGFPPQGPFANNQAPGSAAPNRPANAIVVAVVAALVSAALCLGIGYAAIANGWVNVASTSSLSDVGSSSQSGSGSAPLKSGKAADWTAVSGSVSGSVVSIQTQVSGGVAKGSGAILDDKGHIVTNNHVISGAKQIQVTLANGQMYTAQVVGADTTTDLAVIKLDNPPSDLKPVEFADSDSLAVGQGVMAIGNPLGYDDTATTGIVSALNRPVSVADDNGNAEIVTNAIQIDAAINPGNSGGPTFDAAGKVIGINSSIASTATSSSEAGSIGIGFAIPANLVKRVSQEIIDNGSVKHVQLGVTITDGTAEADGVTRGGAKVASVVSGSPADKAGLKIGDTIVAFNDHAVNNTYSLLGYVRASALGDKVKLTVARDSKAVDVDVTLDQQESASTRSQSGSGNGSQNDNGGNNNDNGDGSGNGNGNGDSGNGDNGLTDPFGLW
ncbi:MAG: trypsin-like peptidase domain-containing protein [Bifidobacterium subtile]|jgi:putative serine protease PepD|nr:trypsin-like peptidase domain-containing protein [Bifidobacterium subtile]